MKRIDYIIITITIITAIILVVIFDIITRDKLPSWSRILISVFVGSMISNNQDDIIYYIKRRIKHKDEK